MAESVTEPGAEHEQAAEEHRVPGGDQRAVRLRRVQAGQHGGQRGDDDRHPEHIDELHQAERGDRQGEGALRAAHPGPIPAAGGG